ncbi:PH and SEC7 domain-containing protein isoform X2 [Anthonomus grandis grandis]|uniref:PH and SEC7 domain-containing protein isoform X2 n=1 Tax=Anthonomus grandis grandis TaxID=2921223 RepID=UPI00216582B1|nr:PH and SEC7 domain-containing protein isoform X2 [Anthonomus grandis grandis]
MAEELLVVLNRSENASLGFSLLQKPGLPPIIYNILDDSPAAESGEVEVGDLILKVNETDVIKYSTREVLKCLRLSSDPVTLKIKRDPIVKLTVRKHLQTSNLPAVENQITRERSPLTGGRAARPEPAVHRSHHHGRHVAAATTGAANGRLPPTEHEPLLLEHERLQGEPPTVKTGAPKFEAYMMTGEHILNISRMPQTTSIVPKQQKKADHSRYHNSHAHHLRHQPKEHNSVPNSPNETDLSRGGRSSGPNSAHTSPVGGTRKEHPPLQHSPQDPYAANSFVRTSRSEDQLQIQNNLGGAVSTANSEADEDVASSLNTLLDTRPDSANSDSDRIVWTYNAPISELHKLGHTLSNGSSSSHSNTSASSSPLHSGSPNSPTSVSSSVMSSQSGSRRLPYSLTNGPQQQQTFTDYSVSEAISNISSPDYHDDDSVGIRDCVMEISDHSDSDSTLLGPEPGRRRGNSRGTMDGGPAQGDHKIVIQVRGPQEKRAHGNGDTASVQAGGQAFPETTEEDSREEDKKSSPLSSEDESDVDSLHSFHYSPKAVDLPSAIRLAKRLYSLDGFKKSDVSRQLSKNNDFSRAVAEEYLKYFNFEKDTLDIALRKFLKQFSLTGETQERERVLVHFSKRYLDCNPGSFNSQDAVHTLTCAIMLLNSDLHSQNIGRKMTCNDFIVNLTDLNEGENFPREILKQLYHAIKNHPLEWALDSDPDESGPHTRNNDLNVMGNPFLDVPNSSNAVEYKKGYVMRKCCYEANAKRSLCCVFLAPFHKRSWKMFYCTLRDMVLYLHKDENGFRKNQMGGDNLHNAIRIHHALATKAQDYTKKQYVFRLQTADQAEYLFQTSDSKELQSWIDTINFVAASFSAPPLEAAVGSQKKFQRPLLPSSYTKLHLREQLEDHEERVVRLEAMLEEHRKCPPEKGAKSLIVQNYKEKETYLNFEIKRYRTYAYMLRSRAPAPLTPPIIETAPAVRLAQNSIGEVDESAVSSQPPGHVTVVEGGGSSLVPPPIPERRSSPVTNRCSLTIVHIIYCQADYPPFLKETPE